MKDTARDLKSTFQHCPRSRVKGHHPTELAEKQVCSTTSTSTRCLGAPGLSNSIVTSTRFRGTIDPFIAPFLFPQHCNNCLILTLVWCVLHRRCLVGFFSSSGGGHVLRWETIHVLRCTKIWWYQEGSRQMWWHGSASNPSSL